MPYGFGIPYFADMLRQHYMKQGQPPAQSGVGGLPQGGMPFEGGMNPYGGFKNHMMQGMGGSGPMGFPNPLAQFRPFMQGANPMGGGMRGGMQPMGRNPQSRFPVRQY